MKRLFLLFCCVCSTVRAQQIPWDFWGVNHWMPNYYIDKPSEPNGKIEVPAVQQLVKDVGAGIYRIGGNGYDKNGTAIGLTATNNDYIRAISLVKAQNPNARFLVQVPFQAVGFTADSALELVQNIKSQFPFEQIYYSIGNEWDLYRHPGSSNTKFSSTYIANSIKAYAVKIKSADSLAKVVAPALASFSARDSLNDTIVNRLFGGVE